MTLNDTSASSGYILYAQTKLRMFQTYTYYLTTLYLCCLLFPLALCLLPADNSYVTVVVHVKPPIYHIQFIVSDSASLPVYQSVCHTKRHWSDETNRSQIN